jgi:hypothetical protein
MRRRIESRSRRRGAALVEYVLLLSLFTLAAVPAISNLQNDEKTALRSTSAKIGGSPVPTDPAPELRSTTTTTTLPPPPPPPPPNNAPIVHLPDGIVVDRDTYNSFSPDVLTDPDGDPITGKNWYQVNGATWQNQSRDQGTENAVLKWTTSGWKTVCFRATDSRGASGQDCCDVCVRTGTVSVTLTATANYEDATNSRWRLRATVRTTNAGGNVNGPMTIGVRFNFSDGTSSNTTCSTTRTSSACTVSSGYKPISISWITATVTSVTAPSLPCFGNWDSVPASATINRSSVTLITTTTTRSTTTTRPASTTTRSTTTTRATTTTTRATTTTTRATTTTRPTTTTFQS